MNLTAASPVGNLRCNPDSNGPAVVRRRHKPAQGGTRRHTPFAVRLPTVCLPGKIARRCGKSTTYVLIEAERPRLSVYRRSNPQLVHNLLWCSVSRSCQNNFFGWTNLD